MVAVKGDVIVVRPRSMVRKRFSRWVKVVYRGFGESMEGAGGVAGLGGLKGSACALLFDGASDNIVYLWLDNMDTRLR